MRWGVTYSALLFNLVFTHGGVSSHEEPADACSCARRFTACARCCARAIARFFDLLLLWGRTRLPARARQPAAVAGEQLQPADARSARRARPTARRTARGRACTCRRQLSATRRRAAGASAAPPSTFPTRAHVAEHVVQTVVRRLPAGLSAGRRELRERRRRAAQQLARAAERPVAQHREPERRAVDPPRPPARARIAPGRRPARGFADALSARVSRSAWPARR